MQQATLSELDGKTARVDGSGFINLPLVGKLQAGGLTVEQVEGTVLSRLSAFLVDPQPVVTISEYRSQPVSVVGAVNNPGVIQLQGKKSLVELISLAGGLRPDESGSAEVTRQKRFGRLTLRNEKADPSGESSTATVDLAALLKGQDVAENITIAPYDIILAPRAELVYVTGEVRKPGGFAAGPTGTITILQALSLAEGLAPQSAPKKARIFRPRMNSQQRDEVSVNIADILAGKIPN